MPSRDCDVNAAPRSTSQPSSASPKPASRASSNAAASACSPASSRRKPRPRYERERPGEIIHLDIKKLGRFNSVGHRITGRRTGHCSSQGAGWEFVHVAIDDHSRDSAGRHLPRPEEGKRRRLPLRHHRLLQEPRRHRRTRHDRQRQLLSIESLSPAPASSSASSTSRSSLTRRRPTARPNASSRPRSENGPTPPPSSTQSSAPRAARLAPSLQLARPHASLARKPPISRLGLTGNNLLRLHS